MPKLQHIYSLMSVLISDELQKKLSKIIFVKFSIKISSRYLENA